MARGSSERRGDTECAPATMLHPALARARVRLTSRAITRPLRWAGPWHGDHGGTCTEMHTALLAELASSYNAPLMAGASEIARMRRSAGILARPFRYY